MKTILAALGFSLALPASAGVLYDEAEAASMASRLESVILRIDTISTPPAGWRAVVGKMARAIGWESLADDFPTQPEKLTGTAFFVSADGLALTAAHVLQLDALPLASRVAVLPDGRRVPVQVVGLDAVSDVALVKVASVRPVPFLQPADAASIQPGQIIYSMGNPNAQRAFAVGMIAGRPGLLDKKSGDYFNIASRSKTSWLPVQIDSQPGASGSPLVNRAGRFVGVLSWGWNQAGQQNYGVPVDLAIKKARSWRAF